MENRRERIHLLDILRGISLFGILLMNGVAMSAPLHFTNPFQFYSGLDDILYDVSAIIINGSFYPIFAFLFGCTFYIIYKNAVNKGQNGQLKLLKRVVILLLFGIIHSVFLFYGDILVDYAICGLLLLLIIRLRARIQLIISIALLSINLMCTLLFSWLLSLTVENDIYTSMEDIESSTRSYDQGQFIDIIQENINFFLTFRLLNIFTADLFGILPIMILGILFIRHQLYKSQWLDKHLLWIIPILLGVGLAIKALPVITNGSLSSQLIASFGGYLVAFGYIGLIMKLMKQRFIQLFMKPFQYIGRFSLTTYITQSIALVIMYYSIGFGLYGDLGLTEIYPLLITIFVVQLIIVMVYRKFFKYGPLEWIWRKATG